MLEAFLLDACACVYLILVPPQLLLQVCSFLADLCRVERLDLWSLWVLEVVVNSIEKLLVLLDGG